MLCGILSKPEAPTTKCALLCHGLTGIGKAGEVFEELAPQLAAAGIASFRFDFRAHGESEGTYNDITLSGEKRDIEAAAEFMRSMNYRTFGIVAASFAAGPVCLFMRENPGVAKAVVFWNPVLEYRWVFESTLVWPRTNFGSEAMGRLRRQGYTEVGKYKLKIGQGFVNEMNWIRPLEFSQNFPSAALFVHGDKDATVPHDHSQRYIKFFKDSRLETVAGADHGFHDSLASSERAIAITKTFLLEKL